MSERYARWAPLTRALVDDAPAFAGVVDRLAEELWRHAEAEGIAVDTSTTLARVAENARPLGPGYPTNLDVVIAEARITYRFTPLGDRMADAVRWRWPDDLDDLRWLVRWLLGRER